MYLYAWLTPVVVFKGTKVGIVEEATVPAPVAAVEPGTTGNEQKQKMLREMTEDCAASEELTPEQRDQFYLLLLANADVHSNDDHPGHTNLVKHRIDTGSSPTIRQPVCQVVPHKWENMLDRKIIQPSSSPWASLIVLVPKKDGSMRFCIDYRKVNAVTQCDAYPLPRIDDMLNTLAGVKWFSTLDMVSGYW